MIQLIFRNTIKLLIGTVLIACNGKREYSNGEYVVKELFNDGKLKAEITYKDSVKNGIVREYFPNGKLKNVGHYLNDSLNGEAISYNEDGTTAAKAFFWKGKNVGPIFYFISNQLRLYNERDYKGEIYYIKKFDSSGAILKEEGLAISPNFLQFYSDTVKTGDVISLYGFYSEPQGYKNILKGYINNSEISIKKMQGHIVVLENKFTRPGKFEFKIVSELSNQNMWKKDSCVKVIYCL